LRSALSAPPVGVFGAGHPAIFATTFSGTPGLKRLFPFRKSLRRRSNLSTVSSISFTFGVGHPPKPLSDLGGADARSAQIGGPDGISQCFQVSAYSGEPFTSSFARNLLSKDDWRAALRDEAEEGRP